MTALPRSRTPSSPASPPTRRQRSKLLRVRELPLAAAVALGAPWPWALAQTSTQITPLTGTAATQTVVGSSQPGTYTVTTATLRDGNAFNNFSQFTVGAGDKVGLVVPTGANWLVNVVRDGRVQVDGLLQGRLGSADGSVGGNIILIDRYGFGVGAAGRIEAGRLVLAAPSATFVDSLLSSGPGMSAASVNAVLGGKFDRSDTGAVQVDGEIHASQGVQIMAGQGAGSAQAVTINGLVRIDGRPSGVAVNLGDLRALSPVVERDGVIDITTPGDVLLNGKLLADASHWSEAGAVRVVAGGNLQLGDQALVSASAASGSGGAGGLVSLFAQGNASNAAGATLMARGDGTGAGGFIELSAARSVQVGGLTMDAGSAEGVAGRAVIDPEDLSVTDSLYTNGASLDLSASKSLSVASGVVLNTRRVSSDPASSGGVSSAATLLASNAQTASIGDSGDIDLTAPSITIGSGAVLDASVVNAGGTSYRAGDIHLTAKNTGLWYATLPGSPVSISDPNASIDVAGTLKGRDLVLSASIESSATYDGTVGNVSQQAISLALDKLGSPLQLSLAYMQATGNAQVTLRDSSRLTASRDIAISATADRSAGAELQTADGKYNVSAGFARIAGSTRIDVQSGAQLQAGRDIGLVAASKTSVTMTAAAAGETTNDSPGSVASVVFAGSMSDVTTAVNVENGASLTAGRDIQAQAFHAGSYETGGEVTMYGAGKAGVVGALSIQNSTTSVSLGGTLTAGGNISALAMNAMSQNVVTASTEIAQTNDTTPLADQLAKLPESLVISDTEAKQKLADGYLALVQKAYEDSEAKSAEGSSQPASSSNPSMRLAGAMTWSQSNHVTRAEIANGATVSATGNVVVDAQTLVGKLQSVSESAATSEVDSTGSKTALSAAINWSDHRFTTQARIGEGAQVNASHVAVNASTDIPEFISGAVPTEWDSFTGIYDNLITFRDGVLTPFYDGFNSSVNASSAASGLAVSGAINLGYITNDTRAWVDRNAHITTTAASSTPWSYTLREVGFDSDLETVVTPGVPSVRLTKDLGPLGNFVSTTRVATDANGNTVRYNGSDLLLDEINFDRTFAGSVVVRGENHVQTFHLAGKPDSASQAGSTGQAVGGTFSMVNRSNTAVAGIADGAVINTRQLDVSAQTSDMALTITPSAGSGAGVAANGMVSYTRLNETTLASISREATVTASAGVNVNADLSLWAFGVTGAVTKSDNSAVGVGVALNEVTGRTRAYIGDNDADASATASNTSEGSVGSISTPALQVRALSAGMVGAIGVAGAMASSSPPASSTASKTSDKVDTQSASATQDVNGNSGSMAALSQTTTSMQSNGAGGGGSGASGESKAPRMQIAGAGAVVTNFSDVDTTALIDGAVIKPLTGGSTHVGVRAISDITQISAAGGGALAMSKNASTTFSSAIAGAVAVQKSDDDTTASIVGSEIRDLADEAGALTVQALKSGERTAVATGISLNLSTSTTSDLSIVGSASLTLSSDDTRASIEGSTVYGKAASPGALDAQVVAYDRSRIGAGAGALSFSKGKGSAGVGATISYVDLQGSTRALVSGGSLTQLHDLDVAALSSQKVVGAGAVAGVQTSSESTGQLMGAFVINRLGNTVASEVTGNAVVNLTGDLSLQAGGAPASGTLDAAIGSMRTSLATDYEMGSTDSGYTTDLRNAVGGGESVLGVAGTLGVSLGGKSGSFGLSYVQNSVQTRYAAELNANVTTGGSVSVQSLSRANVVGVSSGLGASKGKFSGMGSATVNLLGQQSSALVSGGHIHASGLTVEAGSIGNQISAAGNLSLAVGSSSGTAMGAAVAYTQTGAHSYSDGSGHTQTTQAAGNEAGLADAQVDVGSGALTVSAHGTQKVQALAASGAFSTSNVAFAGTATWNEIGDNTAALIDNSLVTAGTVRVLAGERSGGDTASIESLAGGLAASRGYSGALAFGFNTIDSTRSARVTDSNLIVGSSVDIGAASEGSVRTLSIAVAGGQSYAGAGSSSVNWLNADVLAEYDGGGNSLRGTVSSLNVHASGSGSINALAGSVAGAGTGAIGGAVAINHMGSASNPNRVRASLNDLVLLDSAGVNVQADMSSAIGATAASGSGAGTGAISGSVTTNRIAATVQAEATNVRHTSDYYSPYDFSVQASNSAAIASLAGTINGAGQAAAGAAVSVNDIGGEVSANLGSSMLRVADDVSVTAYNSGSIRSIAAGVSGAGSMSAAGSNTTNAIHSAVQATMQSVTMAGDANTLTVRARDLASIESLAGSVSGGGMASGGAALAINYLGRTLDNQDSSKTVLAAVTGGTARVLGDATVEAISQNTIRSAAVAVSGAGVGAFSGSSSTNVLQDDVRARWDDAGIMGRDANRLLVGASGQSTIESLAGNFSGSSGSGVGAAVAVNRIGTTIHGEVVGTSQVYSKNMALSADSDNSIRTLAVGMSAGASGAQGSVAVSVISGETSALVGGDDSQVTNVSVPGSVAVSANSRDRIEALAGAASLGAGGVGLGGGVVTNIISSTTSAGIAGANTHVGAFGEGDGLSVRDSALASSPNLMSINALSSSVLNGASFATRTVKGLAVTATSIQQIGAMTAVASGGASGAAGAALNIDQIGGSTRAYIEDSPFINSDPNRTPATGQSVYVSAANHAMIASSASALAIGSVGVSGAVGTETIDRSTHAEITDSAINAQAGLTLKALSTQSVAQISAGAAGGATAGVAGSGDIVLLRGETAALMNNSSISADSISVLAEGANRSNLIAGSIGGGGAVGAGVSFTLNVSGSTVRAKVNDTTLKADGAVVIDADNTTESFSVSASGAVGGATGVALGASVSVMQGTTDSGLTGNSSVSRRTLASGLVSSANNSPLAIALASDYDSVDFSNQDQVRLSLSNLTGRTNPSGAVVTISDGEKSVTATRLADGTYTANVSGLSDGPLMAQVVLTESGAQKVATTTLFKSTGINSSATAPTAAALPTATTRIATLSSFDQVDARNDAAVRFVLKGSNGVQASSDSVVRVGDGTRSVLATLNADGSYSADVRTLGDGVLTAWVTTAAGETARVTLVKSSGAGSLSVTAQEHIRLNHNTGQIGVGGVSGVGASANVVIGRSTVDAHVDATSVKVSGALNVQAERDADIDMITATAGGGGFAGVSGAVGVLVFGSAPDSNANSELTGNNSTMGSINAATNANRGTGTGASLSASESSTLSQTGRYDTQGAYAGASGLHHTSATVAAQNITAGALSVQALDRTAVDNSAGAIAAGGAAGVSAGVAVTLLGGANHAGVSVGALTVAGDVDIAAGTRTPAGGQPAIDSRAIAGAGGLVGVGAAVSVASNNTASSATLAGTTEAGGAIRVRASDEASMLSEAWGASVGYLTVGVVSATATQQGSVSTTVSGTHSGQGLVAQAVRDASTTATATAGSAGVYAGNGAGASASDSGTVSLTLAAGTALDAGSGDLELSARATPRARTEAIGVSVSRGASVGVSVATSEVDTDVSLQAAGALSLKGNNMLVSAVLGDGDGAVSSHAVAGGGGLLLGAQGAVALSSNKGQVSVSLPTSLTVFASGDVGLSANDAMTLSSSATGVSAGFVGVGVAVARSENSSTVSTLAQGVTGWVQGSLSASARGDESITARAEAGTGGVIAGAGADARVSHAQDVSTSVGTASGLLVVEGVTEISATRHVNYDSQASTLNASAFGGSGAVAQATLTGSATARLQDHSWLEGTQLRVLANNTVERNDLTAISAQGGGGGVLAGAGADAHTKIDGQAVASVGDDVTLVLGDEQAGLLEVRAYNQLRGSSLGRLDLGGAIPIALVDTAITSNANAQASVGARNNIYVAGDVYVNALSYVDLEANTITKTYGAAAAAQGNALASANISNTVSVGSGTTLVSEGSQTLLAGQDKNAMRNQSFVTARADLFNHSAIPVSINPDVQASLDLSNNLSINSTALRSGSTIQLGGIDGSYVVEGKGKVSDWTRDVGQLMGISSEYGSSSKHIVADVLLNGEIEAGHGNKQRLVINPNGSIAENTGSIRFTIGTEDLASTGVAYLDTLYNQLKNYGDIPEVKAFVEAEIAFYLQSLVREGFATIEVDPVTGASSVVPQASVPGTFLTLKSVRAGSGNIELFGKNVTGNASLVARADSEILIDNKSPMNIRVKDLVIDSSGGFAKYNGAYIKSSSDIGNYNTDIKTTGLTVDSIDTRGGASSDALPTIRVINSYVPSGTISSDPVIATARDGSSADLRQDQMRAPEIRVNGLVYNKLGSINLNNTAGSISVVAEDEQYIPRLDGLEVQVSAGKNFILSSPSVSQSVGGSPENLYAVAYNTDQQTKLNNMGVVGCGSARAGNAGATSYDANCLRNGAGGVYASGGIFLGARYLNINGTVQSGQSDYAVTLTDASVGAKINAWKTEWSANRGRYLAQGLSSMVQVSGRLATDSEADVNKRFANGTITLAQRDAELAAMDNRRKEPVIYFDAESGRLKVAETNVTGGLVELVGSIINTGGGVVRALDGYSRFNISNQTTYGIDLLGLDTGGDAGVIRITDLNRPVYTNGVLSAYEVTTYERNAAGQFRSTTTAGRGAGAPVLSSSASTLTSPNASRPELLATFSYAPVTNSTYVWSAGYEYSQEKRYWYQKSSMLWGSINTGSITWNSVETIVKNASAMAEGIYVTTAGAPTGNFSMGTQTINTAAEQQIYRRQWSKCGFLCFKKTYYLDYRTMVGSKDVFTQRVRADHPIAIELVGYNSGLINVSSKGDIRLAGKITNDSGLVSLTSSLGSIQQLSGGAAVTGDDLRFYAANGIGSDGSPINVVTGNGSFTAVSGSGNIAFQSLGGALRVNQVSTTGKVWLMGDEDIVGVDPSAVHVRGSRIELAAPRGGIGLFNADGSVRATLNIQTEDSAGGGITATAARGIALRQPTGNLWVNQIISKGGDVYLESGGDLIDNNRNETRDLRTEQELLALWNAASLQGSNAEASRQLTLRTTRSQFRSYWSMRNAVVTSVNASTGAVTAYTADSFDPATYQFRYTSTEKAQLLQSGMTTAQITAMETARTTEMLELHKLYGGTSYQTNDSLIIAQVNAANLAAGRPAVDAMSTWSDAELKNPLPKAIFSKSSTDTQTRIEEPNVVGNRVVLRPGGKIGRDDGSLTINLRKDGGLTVDEQLAIMSAESDDMVLDKTTWTLKVLKKDTFDVLSNRLNLISNGFVYLGADATDAFPNGGNANLEQVTGSGEVRIKVSGSILNASSTNTPVLQGYKAVLEAATGTIGSALRPLTMTLTGGGTASNATLVARAQDGIWINQTGDIRLADVYSPGFVALTAQGSIIDARGPDRTRSIEAGEVSLTALGGSVGTALNPIVAKASATGGVNASTPAGFSVYLQGAETGLTVKNIQSGLDIDLYAPTGDLRALGTATAAGRIDAEADTTGNVTMASGSLWKALTGDIYVGANNVGLSQLDASKAVVVNARGAITDTSTATINVNAAGRSVTLMALGSIGAQDKPVDVLGVENTRLVATSRDGDAYVSSDTAALRVSQVSAKGTAGLSSAYSVLDERGTRTQAIDATNVRLSAGGDIGQASVPMTVSTAAGGAVQLANATGSVYLSAPVGVLTVQDGNAATGNVSLMGTVAGLALTGDLRAANGMLLNAGSQNLTLSSTARLSNAANSLSMQGLGITMADGARVDGGNGTVAMTATNNITLTGVSSANASTSAITVTSTSGAVRDAGDTNAYDLRASNATGGIVVSAAGAVGDGTQAAGTPLRALETDASVLQVTSKAGSVYLSQAGATRDVNVTAALDAELASNGSLIGTRVAALGGSVLLNSQTGGVNISTLSVKQDLTIKAAGNITVGTLSVPGNVSLWSTGAGITTTSLSAGKSLAIQADSATGQSNLGTLSALAGTLSVNVAGTLGISTGTASGDLTVNSGKAASVGTLTSSTGKVTVVSNDALTFTKLSAATDLSASSTGTFNGGSTASGTLTTATSGKTTLSSASGLTLTGAISARTGLAVSSGAAMSLYSFAVSAGGASLTTTNTGSGLALQTTGSATGNVSVNSTGATSLGTLTSSAGSITADSKSTLGFTKLSAATDLSASSTGTFTGGSTISGTLTTAASGKTTLTSASGLTLTGAISARTGLLMTSAASMTLSSFAVSAGTADFSTTGANAGYTLQTTGSASGNISVKSTGAASLGTLTSSAGSITADSKGTLAFTKLSAATDLSASSTGTFNGGSTISGSLASGASGNTTLTSASGLTMTSSVSARTGLAISSGAAMSLYSFAVSAGGASLTTTNTGSGLALQTTGSATGNVSVNSTGATSLGTLTSSAGSITADSKSTLGFTKLSAATDLSASSTGTFTGGTTASGTLTTAASGKTTLTSGSGLTLTSASARTGLLMTSAASMTLSSFTVSAGGADFSTTGAGANYTLQTTGSATGNINVTTQGVGALGSMTASAGKLTASSQLGLTFGALKATSIQLRNWSDMTGKMAIQGTSLTATNGGVDVYAFKGNIKIGTLSATAASSVKTGSGTISITTKTLPTNVALTLCTTCTTP